MIAGKLWQIASSIGAMILIAFEVYIVFAISYEIAKKIVDYVIERKNKNE